MKNFNLSDNILIISLEGLDTSGKSTQVKLLATKLKLDGYKVKTLHFPNYDSPTGKLIKEFLNTGETSFIQSLYVLDQLKFFLEEVKSQKQIKHSEAFDKIIKDYNILILDRYDISTLAYGMANSFNMYSKYDEIINMQNLLPKPNMTFILDLPATNVLRRKKVLDSFESDIKFLSKVRECYKLIPTLDQTSRIYKEINATKSLDDVSNEIYSYTKKYLKSLIK